MIFSYGTWNKGVSLLLQMVLVQSQRLIVMTMDFSRFHLCHFKQMIRFTILTRGLNECLFPIQDSTQITTYTFAYAWINAEFWLRRSYKITEICLYSSVQITPSVYSSSGIPTCTLINDL